MGSWVTSVQHYSPYPPIYPSNTKQQHFFAASQEQQTSLYMIELIIKPSHFWESSSFRYFITFYNLIIYSKIKSCNQIKHWHCELSSGVSRTLTVGMGIVHFYSHHYWDYLMIWVINIIYTFLRELEFFLFLYTKRQNETLLFIRAHFRKDQL